jgi:ferrous iron transport protein B
MVFVRRAGTIILLISVVLWAMITYPKMPDDAMSPAATARVSELEAQAAATADAEQADVLLAEAGQVRAGEAMAYSIAGRLGRAVEPVFDPLGFDWKVNVGVLSSFAAREVIVSTLSIVYGLGEEGAEDEATLVSTMKNQARPDGMAVFNTATCMSLLVFYVLAMQCLPTQVVTKRETGSWKWALLQLGYMTTLAWTAALITYQTATALGY